MSSTDPSLQAARPSRPSLLTPSAHGQPPASGMRMLDGLGVATPPKARVGRWIWLLPVIGLGLAVFALREQAFQSIPSLTPLISKMTVGDGPQASASAASAVVSPTPGLTSTGPALVVAMGSPPDGGTPPSTATGETPVRNGAAVVEAMPALPDASNGSGAASPMPTGQPPVPPAIPTPAAALAQANPIAIAGAVAAGSGRVSRGANSGAGVGSGGATGDGALRPLPAGREAALGDAAGSGTAAWSDSS